MKRRGSGILLHVTSLPSPFGVGDLGPAAYRFIDFLAESGQSYWQVLPLNPTMPVYGNSPYASTSAFAGSTLLISPEPLVQDGFLGPSDLQSVPQFPEHPINHEAVHEFKRGLWERAYARFKAAGQTQHTRDSAQMRRGGLRGLLSSPPYETTCQGRHGATGPMSCATDSPRHCAQ